MNGLSPTMSKNVGSTLHLVCYSPGKRPLRHPWWLKVVHMIILWLVIDCYLVRLAESRLLISSQKCGAKRASMHEVAQRPRGRHTQPGKNWLLESLLLSWRQVTERIDLYLALEKWKLANETNKETKKYTFFLILLNVLVETMWIEVARASWFKHLRTNQTP